MAVGGSELIAALIGAAATGAFGIWDKIRDRKHRRETNLVAIASEVAAVCHLIRYQGYLEFTSEVANSIRSGVWDGGIVIVDMKENYFSVFEALSHDIGLLKPEHARKIVQFYAYCKAAIDSTRPDGIFVNEEPSALKAESVLSLEGLLREILALGDEVVQMPKALQVT